MFHHRDEIGDAIEERTKEMTPDEVVKLVGKIPAQQHVHLEDVVDDAILRDRNMIAPVMASDGEEMLIANFDGGQHHQWAYAFEEEVRDEFQALVESLA